ncbi:MAG: GT4 family glycosyltransferase PelF [Planctomycetota bacterium]
MFGLNFLRARPPEPAPTAHRSTGVEADVALLLEGTYPYVRGGVSSWVHTLITGLPQVKFSIIFLGGSPDHYEEIKYVLPENVVHLEVHFLIDKRPLETATPGADARCQHHFENLRKIHDQLREGLPLPEESLRQIAASLTAADGIDRETFLSSFTTWEYICNSYLKYSTEPSFVDYFWTIRTIHEPLFTLARIAKHAPVAKIYHSISTGYAGFLGALISRQQQRPFILSEHGIYTKERKIDLAQAEWIHESKNRFDATLHTNVSYIRSLWIRFFASIGRMTYSAADPITSLYEGNRQKQIEDGADAQRCRIIPNGIDLARFAKLREKRPQDVPPVVGLLGRVVPIKDIKTFIRSMRTVCSRLPEAEGWIIGPEDEDESYARECHDLVASLGLEERVKFLGFQKPDDILPQLGLLVLTSISEALPLVVLEAYASGLPCVTTDVGSCRELIEGNTEPDRSLGHSGAVVPIADPQATAERIVELLGDPARWHAAQQAGIQRVERYYTLEMMLDTYLDLYRVHVEVD